MSRPWTWPLWMLDMEQQTAASCLGVDAREMAQGLKKTPSEFLINSATEKEGEGDKENAAYHMGWALSEAAQSLGSSGSAAVGRASQDDWQPLG